MTDENISGTLRMPVLVDGQKRTVVNITFTSEGGAGKQEIKHIVLETINDAGSVGMVAIPFMPFLQSLAATDAIHTFVQEAVKGAKAFVEDVQRRGDRAFEAFFGPNEKDT